MLNIQTWVDIQATPARIWAILINFAHYPEWNPRIIAAAGVARPGQTLSLILAKKPGRTRTVRAAVLEARAGEALVWRQRSLLPGLLDSEYCFTLATLDDGAVRLSHSAHFSGLLSPLLRRPLSRTARDRLEAINLALRERAERHNIPRHI